jgi:hypothetical protein
MAAVGLNTPRQPHSASSPGATNHEYVSTVWVPLYRKSEK